MATPFSYWKPILGSYGLEQKNHTEYHIHLEHESNKCERYNNYTDRDLWDDVAEYLKSKFENAILKSESDRIYDTEERYIWVHLDLATGKETVKAIVTSLNEKYMADWAQYVTIPKLGQIIKEKLRDTKFLLESTCEHQRQFGYESTQAVISTYLRTRYE